MDRNLPYILGELFSTVNTVENLLEDAGFELAQLPVFGQDPPITYWKKVIREIEKGRFPYGKKELLDAARQEFPYNQELLGFGSQHKRLEGNTHQLDQEQNDKWDTDSISPELIQYLVERNQLKRALEALAKRLSSEKSTILILISRLKSLVDMQQNGMITSENLIVQENHIRQAILDLLNMLPPSTSE